MKALSVKPRWADLIRSGVKTIEVRSRRTKHRGALLICSTKPDGHARCVVEIVDCRPMRDEDWESACCEPRENCWGWIIGKVIPIEPFPVTGQMGIFDIVPPQEVQNLLPQSGEVDLYTQSSP